MSTVQQQNQDDDNNTEVMIQNHLDWSDKQQRILTANGKMEEYYSTQNGYLFTNNELPHYYIQNKMKDDDNNEHSKTIFDMFHQWKIEEEQEEEEQKKYGSNYISPIFGVWKRTLFYSTNTYDYTTNDIEYTFNIQTNTLFIDLRIPKSRDQLFSLLQQQQHETKQIQSLNDMDGNQLRLYARQHIFAGYTRIVPTYHNKDDQHERPSSSSILFPYCATRFHCIDWNYIGTSRSRPNKWYIELPTAGSSHTSSIDSNTNHSTNRNTTTTTTKSTTSSNIQQWKEWAYATNEYKQHYYCEYWERYSSTHMTTTSTTSTLNNDEIYLILRIQSSDNDTTMKQKDGIIIIYNDQIMYCIDRCSDIYPFHNNISSNNNNSISSLVALIDDLILQQNDLETARSWLSIQGGHGQWIKDTTSPKQVSSSNHNPNNNNNIGAWILDHCIEFWLQGQSLFNNTLHTNNHESNITITGTSIDDCNIIWKNHIWTIFDTNLQSIDTVRKLILYGPQ